MKERIYLISLGCAKNLVDSEHMLGILNQRGYSVVSDLEEADLAIVNTCGFIQSAAEEAIETILRVAEKKAAGYLKNLVVAGCLVQRYGLKLRKHIPEVDAWLGPGEIAKIADIADSVTRGQGQEAPIHLGRPLFLADHRTPRLYGTPFYSGYLKIAEGCSHRCSFCTIPSLRGPYRSRKIDSLVMETESMVEGGVKEINLIAQDTTMYGRDLGEGYGLEDLLEEMLRVKHISWIRLLYCHPQGVTDRLLDLLDGDNAVCPYLDVPFQHVNREILRRMGREPARQDPRQLVERIKTRTRNVSLRTTLMVGFPGETQEIFQELCDFVSQGYFDHVGAFVYSPEKGTMAARMKDKVEADVARERLDILMRIQADISLKKNREMIGNVIPVLNEGVHPETDLLLRGRSQRMAPDVDSHVIMNAGEGPIGDIVQVRVTDAHEYDLIGEILQVLLL
ncbi:MAG: 30S ribosomal protein S12 methylthiotransferase RimO [Deltaproteobacteria bacterium]|nr:30S ribosomal protein S12 methylthiotransferase RimO [Deltaproteobacteria bacterium]MBW2136349.1 30S ribosomal protein S12 methylthiotransferase RimO [Deltaproteobacteria bacterium]